MATRQANGTNQAKQQRKPEGMLPYSTEAEEGVLGSIILIDEEVFENVCFLKVEDFYHDWHRTIYEAMLRLARRREPIDFITVDAEIDRMGRSEDRGEDRASVNALFNGVPTTGNAVHYANIVKQLSVCRQIIHGIGQTVGPAYAGNAEEAAEILEKTVYELRMNTATGSDLTPLRDLSSSFYMKLDSLHQQKQTTTGVPTGLIDLDRITGGLQKSDLIILAARTSIGKTSLAMTIACNAAMHYNKGVAAFSLEMSKEQLYQRLIAMDAGVDQQDLRIGNINDEQWERVIQSIDALDRVPIFIDDTPAINCREIERKVRRLIAQGIPIDLIIVDYLGFMKGTGGSRENRVQEVSEIVRDLKGVARELNLPILCLSQISRAVENRQSKIPQLSDLKESGEIEQTADVVLLIYREDVYNPDSERKNIADIFIAKQRNGPTGVVTTYFKKSHTRFETLEVITGPEEEEHE